MRANWQDKWKGKRGSPRKGHGWPLRAELGGKEYMFCKIIIVYVVLHVNGCVMND